MRQREWKRLKVGSKVVAATTVYDLPPDMSWIHAHKDDEGVVIHAEPGHVAVRFYPRQTVTDVHWTEVKLPQKD